MAWIQELLLLFFFFNFQETPEDPAETIMTALFLAVNVRAEGGPEA